MRYRIVYEKAPHNYCAYSPDLPGCIATGDTLDECRILMREAIALHLELSRKHGDPVPPDPTGYAETLDFEPERPRRARPKRATSPARRSAAPRTARRVRTSGG